MGKKVMSEKMIVFVRYEEYEEASHIMLDGHWVIRSKVVAVSDLLSLNKMFNNKIISIEIMDNGKKEFPVNGLEMDCVYCRRYLKLDRKLRKYVKRTMNKRFRKRYKKQAL